MAHRIGDRVEDTTTSTGTGNITVSGTAPTGKRTLSAVCTVNADTIDAVIAHQSQHQWEAVRLTRVSANEYSRAATPWASSTGSAIDFDAGPKEVFGDVSAFFARHLNPVEISIAAAATCDIGALNGLRVEMTGDPTVTSLGTVAGQLRIVRVTGNPIWTYNASTLILRDGASRQMRPGDISILASDASGNWTELMFSREGALAGRKNYLDNPSFMIAKRGTSFISTTVGAPNNDGNILLDRWRLLSDGNDIVDVTQVADSPVGASGFAIGLDVETVNKKFGICQILERRRCYPLIGKTVTLSAALKVTNATRLDKIKMAILTWAGTQDSPTVDVVSAWGADGTNPTLATSWTYENTPADLGVTTSWARYSVTAPLDSGTITNVAVLIWSDNVTDTDLGDFLYITDVKLELGGEETPYDQPNFIEDWNECDRFFKVISRGLSYIFTESATVADATLIDYRLAFTGPPLRHTSFTLITSGTAGDYSVTDSAGAGGGACTSVPQLFSGSESIADNAWLRFTKTTHGLTGGIRARLLGSAAGFLWASAEL